METSATLGELASALYAFQSEVPSIKKDSTNPFYGSKYASLDSVWETIRPLFKMHGLSLVQLPEGDEHLTNLLTHRSGEWMKSSMRLYFGQQARRGEEPKETKVVTPQIYGIALQYARRYSMAAILGLSMDEDDDGEGIEEQRRNQQGKRPGADMTKPLVKPDTRVALLAIIREQLRKLPADEREPTVYTHWGCTMADMQRADLTTLQEGMTSFQAAVQGQRSVQSLMDELAAIAHELPEHHADRKLYYEASEDTAMSRMQREELILAGRKTLKALETVKA